MKKLIQKLCIYSVIGCSFFSVGAVNADNEPVKNGTIAFEYMGIRDTPQTNPHPKHLTEKNIGNEFWVGVTADGINKNKILSEGIFSMEIAFEYDPKYVEPYYIDNDDATTDWKNRIIYQNVSSARSIDFDNRLMWDRAQYKVSASIDRNLNYSSNREDLYKAKNELTNAGWRMCTVNITVKDGIKPNRRFYAINSREKQYLIKVPFRLKDIPEIKEQEVLSIVKGPETFNIGCGEDGTEPYCQWYSDESECRDKNIKALLYNETDIDLYGSEMSWIEHLIESILG